MNEIDILKLIKANKIKEMSDLVANGTNLNFYNTTWEISPIIQAIDIMSKDMVEIVLKGGGGIPEYNLGQCLERLIVRQLNNEEPHVEICRMLIRHDLNELYKIGGHYLGMHHLKNPKKLPLLREILKWGIGIEQINLPVFLDFNNQGQPNFPQLLMTILAAGVSLRNLEFKSFRGLRTLSDKDLPERSTHNYGLLPDTYWIFMLAGLTDPDQLEEDLKYLKYCVQIEYMEDLSVEYQKFRANYQWDRFRTARITTIFDTIIGLAPLELSTHEQIAILNERFPEYAELEDSYSYFWRIITTVKHSKT